MYKKILYLIIFFSSPFAFSEGTNLSCLFKKPILFGASITANYGGYSDAIKGAYHNTRYPDLKHDHPNKHLGKNFGPLSRLAKKHNPSSQIINISEIINVMHFSGIGYDQFFSFINEKPDDSEEATLFASLDSLYWPAAYNRCEEAILQTNALINYAQSKNKPLILATIPEEDPNKVPPLFKGFTTRSGKSYMQHWWPPELECLTRINSFLRNKYVCNEDKGCFLIDIHYMIKDLEGQAYTGDELGIVFKGINYLYHDFRGDGIHLIHPIGSSRQGAPPGVRYIMKNIEDKLINSKINFCEN